VPTEPAHALADIKGAEASNESTILAKMKKLEKALTKEEDVAQPPKEGKIEVNGPVPADFAERFHQAAAAAAGINPVELTVLDVQPLGAKGDLAEVLFKGAKDVVLALENQAADPASKLTNSPIRSFLIARDSTADAGVQHLDYQSEGAAQHVESAAVEDESQADASEQPSSGKSIDIDTAMPYGELEPFGREDTAQELTEQSVKDSDEMVDQVERAEVAEEKRSVFRALTRLRGAAITSFDGVARSQTGNIDEYNKVHKWRSTHPLHHLADEESDISKWAFPDNADF